MQREFYTILHQLQLVEYDTIIDNIQANFMIKHLRRKHTDSYIMINAASNGNIHIVKLLLNLRDNNKYCDIDWDTDCDATLIIKMYMNSYADHDIHSAISSAAENGYIDIVRILLDYGCTITSDTLENAACGGYTDILQLLFDRGAGDIDWTIDNPIEFSLTYAAECGDINVVRILLDNGATNLNYVIECAACFGHIDIVQLLLDNGADNYNSSMREAARNGYINIVRLLLLYGANNYQECIDITKYDDIKDLLRTYM